MERFQHQKHAPLIDTCLPGEPFIDPEHLSSECRNIDDEQSYLDFSVIVGQAQ